MEPTAGLMEKVAGLAAVNCWVWEGVRVTLPGVMVTSMELPVVAIWMAPVAKPGAAAEAVTVPVARVL